MIEHNRKSICYFLEGSYPYVSGGVSQWIHDMILSFPQYDFHLVCLTPPASQLKLHYNIPDNVKSITNVNMQTFPEGALLTSAKRGEIIKQLSEKFIELQTGSLDALKEILKLLHHQHSIGSRILLDSNEAWQMVVQSYCKTLDNSSFLNFFWSWRSLMAAFYSILLNPYPLADLYHSPSTGYAGLFLARAHLETGRPCLVTEHGIYTNERKIEILTADWLQDQKAMDLSIEHPSKDLRDFWIDTFEIYSKLCYQASENIITLFEENQQFQIAAGAPLNKLMVIPNGIDLEKYQNIKRMDHQNPVVALIGRVVPIKDVKTFIQAVQKAWIEIPNLKAYVLGPTEEDPTYFKECQELVKNLGLDNVIEFTGKVNMLEYLSKIDLLVLTSISESQPLVILEAGAVGIPCIATDVGSCRELIDGHHNEQPRLHPGGKVSRLGDSAAIGKDIVDLLQNKALYRECSQGMKRRVETYYRKEEQIDSYKKLYSSLLEN